MKQITFYLVLTILGVLIPLTTIFGQNTFRKNATVANGSSMPDSQLNGEQQNSGQIIHSIYIAHATAPVEKSGHDYVGANQPEIKMALSGLRHDEPAVPLTNSLHVISHQDDRLKSEIDDLKEAAFYTNEAISLDNTTTLEKNEPNPFNQQITIRYSIPSTFCSAFIQVSNKKGKVMKTFFISDTGKGKLIISGGTLEAGVYYNTLIVDEREIDTKQMILTR